MQLVQTFIRFAPPLGVFTRIDCRLGLKTRGVRLFACETLLPNCGPLPQTSQRLAMIADSPVDTRTTSRCGSALIFETKSYSKRVTGRSRQRAAPICLLEATQSGKSRIIS